MSSPKYVQVVEPSCAANTPASSPIATQVGISTAWLWEVNVRIPPGHAGLTGIALVDGGQFVVPYGLTMAQWLVGDDDDLTFPYDEQIGSKVDLFTYNTDNTNVHAWQVRLVYTPMSAYLDDTSDILVTPMGLGPENG
jgi:hypothetical protein